MSYLNCHVVANWNLPSWPWPAFLPLFFLSKPIRGSLASMGLADSSRRIRIADIELAYRITGRGKPVILVHVARLDGSRRPTTFLPKYPPKPLAFLAILYDIWRQGVTVVDTAFRYPQPLPRGQSHGQTAH